MSDPNKNNEANPDKVNELKKLQELLSQLTTEQHDELKKNHEEYLNRKGPDEPSKTMEEFLFWKTQPVPQFGKEQIALKQGPIDTTKNVADISREPVNLSRNIEGFEWCTLDSSDDAQLEEIYTLLNENYVEDLSSTMRFDYSKEFLRWAISPPGTKDDWQVGIRAIVSKKLVAFISAVPLHLKINNAEVNSVEINFLCVHKKLRSKRLAPVLIKEITRRVNLYDIWQALYTAGVVLPKPITTTRYTHRPLNWNKLYDVGFVADPEGVSEETMKSKYVVNKKQNLKYVPFSEEYYEETAILFEQHHQRYKLQHIFKTKEEFLHQFLPRKNVLRSFVTLNDEGKVTDFISYYILPFNVLGDEDKVVENLKVAYLFHYCSDCATTLDEDRSLSARLRLLIQDMLTDAYYGEKCDLFNCLTTQDNGLFIEKENFGMGSGFLNFYLFNYFTEKINGGVSKITKDNWVLEKTSEVGVVMI
ncbi:hypothetical protein QEN19_003280 [Hanseniaspora menglaensis]